MARTSLRALLWALLLVLQFGLAAAWAQDLPVVPKLTARVTDTTGSLSAEQRGLIEAQLAAIETRKGSQVAVLIVPSTAPEAIEEFSLRVAEAWKLGRAKAGGQQVDDGVLLLVAKNDRKLRIEVGRGLEGAIPDALAKRIIAETIAPRFRQGDIAGGVTAGVTEIGRLIDGETLPAPWQGAHGQESDSTGWVVAMVVALVVGLIGAAIVGRLFASIGVGAGAGLWSVAQGLPLIMGAGIGIGAFLAILFIASMGGGGSKGPGSGIGRAARSSSGPIWTSGGSGWSGGGGSSSGGGFSGGGGDFGGGGASGDW